MPRSLPSPANPAPTTPSRSAARRPSAPTATAAPITHQFWLRNGTYPATLTLTDRVGNTTTTKRTLKVAFDRPALTLTRSTPDNATSTTFDVTATPRSTGAVTIPGHDPLPFEVPDDGRATIQTPLADGSYPAGTVTLTDFGGRRTTATVPAFTIDTAPPTLAGSIDRGRLRDGLTRLALRTERGVAVAPDRHAHQRPRTAPPRLSRPP